MKAMEYRVTNHEWYAIVRSFIIVGMMFVFVYITGLLMGLVDSQWLHFSMGGTVVKAISALISIGGGTYCGIKWTAKLFDKKSTMVIDDEKVILTKSGKQYQLDLSDIKEVRKRIFVAYGDRKDKDSKIFGPLYVEYVVVSERGVLCESCSVAEGWEKMEKKFLNKDGFIPEYTINEAYKKLEAIVEERKRCEAEKLEKAMAETE